MLKTIQLKNFKGFRDQRIEFSNFSVVIGRNNAGKSSAFEAIRIVSNVCAKLLVGKFTHRPSWLAGEGVGILPSLDDPQRKPETLFFRYEDPPAIIEAAFSNGSRLEVFIGEGGVLYAEAVTPSERSVDSRSKARECGFPTISLLPQIRPLEDYEKVLRADYVRKCVDTHLTSRHFRNQIRYFREHFESFCDLFQQTWKGVRVSEFIAMDAQHEEELSLMLMDDGFVAEAANFGHGMQMWLQIIWFLARTPSENVIVLDEPDVYMHPQQQACMVSLLRDRFNQCLLSTHSEQIINACTPDELLRLHRKLDVSKHGTSQSDYEAKLERANKVVQPQTINSSGRTVKVVLYGQSAISINNDAGVLVASLECAEDGETHRLSLPSGRYHVELLSPQDIDLFVDGESRSYMGDPAQQRVEFVLDLS